ncbi:MAG: translation initiation factor IF-2 [Bacteriovoracia bacterium]
MTSESTKVYELAKELGMDSFSLLDKLKELNISVKNHMSELKDTDVSTVREHFSKKADDKPATTKKTVTRRSAATKTVAPAATTKTRGTTKKSEKKVAPTTVIRRRSKSQQEESQKLDGQEEVQEEVQASAQTEETAPTEQAVAETTEQAVQAPPPAPEEKGSGLKIPSLLGARSEGISTKTGGILKIVKDAPKIVRTPRQLQITKAATPGTVVAKPKFGGHTPSAAGIVSLGKEAIEKMLEEETSHKKKAPGAKGEKDPAEANIADYRAKKELVFLPKRKKIPVNKELRHTQITVPAAHKRVVRINNAITVTELAQRMGVKSNEIIKKLMQMGVMATLNQPVDFDTATLIASEYKFETENVAFHEDAVIPQVEDSADSLQPRPPIVTVMGHVDHGKTSLLDAIRSANVAAGEAGGITQHIGAYTVQLDDKKITFIDTPGHEAFTVMRARGANVTDIVILVVAADDGVMPQTREAVDHARAANVPIIVAVNKMDKPGANPEKVMKQLAELNLLSEAWGGDAIFVNVSATQRTGIKELLEAILLQAEVLDLKANPERLAEGTVLESRLDRSRGAVVSILVKKGTLRVGDTIVAGAYCGRVRALMDDKGRQLKEAGPSQAAELLGLEGVPIAGDTLNAMKDEASARELASHRAEKQRSQDLGVSAKAAKMTLEELFSKAQAGEVKELGLVLKTDVVGSMEALKDSLSKLSTDKVKVKILSASTGGITESDILLATASNAIILGFNVRPETKARAVAEKEGIEIKCYSIIYELLDDVKKAMTGLLEKKAVEKYLGRAEVRNTFSVPKVGTIAGCGVIDGKVTRTAQVRVLRDSRIVYTGKVSSLKRFKDDAKEVAQGYECGISIENYNDIKTGDLIEFFTIEMVAQELEQTTNA